MILDADTLDLVKVKKASSTLDPFSFNKNSYTLFKRENSLFMITYNSRLYLLIKFNKDYSESRTIASRIISFYTVWDTSFATYTFYNDDLYITFRWSIKISKFQQFYETYTLKTDLNFTRTDCNKGLLGDVIEIASKPLSRNPCRFIQWGLVFKYWRDDYKLLQGKPL